MPATADCSRLMLGDTRFEQSPHTEARIKARSRFPPPLLLPLFLPPLASTATVPAYDFTS